MRLALALVLGVVAIGCEKSGKKIPDDPQPRPAALIMQISLPSATSLEGLREVASAIQPAAGLVVDPTVVMMAAASAVGAKSLAALDAGQPLHALWLDDGKLRGLALVGRIKDDDALDDAVKPATVVRKDGWAVIGPKDVVDVAAPYALTTLVQTAPAAPTAKLYMTALVKRYNDMLVGVRNEATRRMARSNPGAAGMVTPILDGFLSLLRETDEVDLVASGGQVASLDLTIVPRAETTFAGFVAGQKPSPFELVGTLPAAPGPVVATGRFVLGPYRDAIQRWLHATYDPAGKDMIDQIAAIAGGTTGEFALGFEPAKIIVMQLVELESPPAVDAAVARIIDGLATPVTITTGKLVATYKALPPAEHAGVVVRQYETSTDTSKLSPRARALVPTSTWTTAIATFDKRLVFTYGGDTTADIGRLIDAARDAGPRFRALPEIAAARDHKESVFAAYAGGPGLATLTVGFANHTLHLHASVPVAVARALANPSR